MLTTKKPSQFSPLALAYIGDGVYELFVRTRIIEEHENLPANKLHKKTVQYVKAHAQSNSIDAMLEHMTDDETAVYKRGRNAKSNTVPKNANMTKPAGTMSWTKTASPNAILRCNIRAASGTC